MRIIAGKYKSRLIKIPKDENVRPMQDRVKESIFNILGNSCSGARVLDLFSGSGSLGIEALSRGAKEVIFVDNNIRCIQTIKENLKSLNIGHNARVIKSDALKAVKRLGQGKEFFNVVFLDPPYFGGMIEKSLIAIDKCGIITNSGIVVTHHFKKESVPELAGRLCLARQNSYGDKIISFYNPLKNKELGE